MNHSVIDFKYFFSLTPQWRQKFIDELGATLSSDKRILVFDSTIASGESFFVELLPGLSVLLIDAVVQTPIQFKRASSTDDFWIINYDLGDHLNKHIVNKSSLQDNEETSYGLEIIDSNDNCLFTTEKANRIYTLKIFIDKTLFKDFLRSSKIKEEYKSFFNRRKKNANLHLHIDSRSKVVLFNLKKQHIRDINFEFALKSTVFSLLVYFLERVSSNLTIKQVYEKDLEAITRSQHFLLSRLYHPFPGIEELAQIANMSTSKYNKVYKSMYGISPAHYFKNEKLKLANVLLSSGKYSHISDVAFELGYNKATYFTMLYKKSFGVLPSKHFRKSEN